MYKLFYSPGACSLAVHVVLHECSLPVELVKVDLKAPARPPELLKYNPRGQVPTLVEDGDHAVLEGAAIMITLCEAAKSPLLPASGRERTDALQWLMFCNASLHPAYSRVFGLSRATVDAAAKEQLLEAAVAQINRLWELVEERLAGHPYLGGETVTCADILATVIANWSGNLPKPVTLGPKTKALLKTISSRPAFKKALEMEQVEYKAAA